MPVVIFHANDQWLPTATRIKGQDLAGLLHDSQLSLTYEMIQRLPEIVADAVNTTDSSNLTKLEVLIVPIHFHPWAVNTNDWWIDIEPSEIGTNPIDQLQRRYKIRNSVRERVGDFIAQHPNLIPATTSNAGPLAGRESPSEKMAQPWDNGVRLTSSDRQSINTPRTHYESEGVNFS